MFVFLSPPLSIFVKLLLPSCLCLETTLGLLTKQISIELYNLNALVMLSVKVK